MIIFTLNLELQDIMPLYAETTVSLVILERRPGLEGDDQSIIIYAQVDGALRLHYNGVRFSAL